eukprot:TRINITY_DN29248_c0_g1_i1.p1 TRINITY_DN29248_c0_g1~~TRINITY_DN29248_c0_g1_i1.p1  ORF type:complete len:73 (+),score=15.55 TRINITY_DN29248_c0_g1_i1:55-273(+)
MATILRQTPIMNLFGKTGPMVTVNKSTTVKDTLQVLSDNNIISVPVADQTIASFPKHLAGFVDFLDIIISRR